MAKKVVATLRTGKTDGRSYTKVIKMVKNPDTGSYMFNEQMVPNEAVKDFFKNWYSVVRALEPLHFREGQPIRILPIVFLHYDILWRVYQSILIYSLSVYIHSRSFVLLPRWQANIFLIWDVLFIRPRHLQDTLCQNHGFNEGAMQAS